jgi:hypothetical protein
MTGGLKALIPEPVLRRLSFARRETVKSLRRFVELLGYTVARRKDFYSPLPVESELAARKGRWNRPSALSGVDVDLGLWKRRLEGYIDRWADEFRKLPPYIENAEAGFGPGYNEIDALLLYSVLRERRPARYLEVGSGLSTLYASFAAAVNAGEGSPMLITCVEPDPYPGLLGMKDIEILEKEVQDIPLDRLVELEERDVLFIDSSHVVKIDGDVPYLILEVLPRIPAGVAVHIHDIPFPYNTPFPAGHWVLGKERYSPGWPMFWTEAMMLQAFLAFNERFEILLSLPLLRFHDEDFLRKTLPRYRSVEEEPNTFSSIWLERRPDRRD